MHGSFYLITHPRPTFNSFEDETNEETENSKTPPADLSIPLRMKHSISGWFARAIYLSIPLRMKHYVRL